MENNYPLLSRALSRIYDVLSRAVSRIHPFVLLVSCFGIWLGYLTGMYATGSYHGRLSFDAFSHRRAVVITPTWLDLPFRYMPYKMFGLVKKLL